MPRRDPGRPSCFVLTYLVSDGECGVKAVVLDDGAASLWRADCADVRHAQGVARVVAAQVLDKGSDAHLNHCLNWKKQHNTWNCYCETR